MPQRVKCLSWFTSARAGLDGGVDLGARHVLAAAHDRFGRDQASMGGTQAHQVGHRVGEGMKRAKGAAVRGPVRGEGVRGSGDRRRGRLRSRRRRRRGRRARRRGDRRRRRRRRGRRRWRDRPRREREPSRRGVGRSDARPAGAEGSRRRGRDRRRRRARRSRSGAGGGRATVRIDGRDSRLFYGAFAHSPDNGMAEQDRHASAGHLEGPTQPLAHQARARGEPRQEAEPLAPRRAIHHGHDLAATLQDAGCHRREQRAAAGDQHPPARQDRVRLEEHGRGRETDHARQGPAGERHHALEARPSPRRVGGRRTPRCRRARAHRPGTRSVTDQTRRPNSAATVEPESRARRASPATASGPCRFASRPLHGARQTWPPAAGASSRQITARPQEDAASAALAPAGPAPTTMRSAGWRAVTALPSARP